MRVLDLQGIVHARSGRGRALVWHPCARREGVPVPGILQLERYVELVRLLSSRSERWHATDFLTREAGFDPDLRYLEQSFVLARREFAGLPAGFFYDVSKSARKYVLGRAEGALQAPGATWQPGAHSP